MPGVLIENQDIFIDTGALEDIGPTSVYPIIFRPARANTDFRADPPTFEYPGSEILVCPPVPGTIYTWVPLVVEAGPGGVTKITTLNKMSSPASERRPKVVDEELIMDAGHINCYQ